MHPNDTLKQKYLSQIEQGDKNVTFKTLELLLERGYGIKPSSLFFGPTADSRREENGAMIALFHQFLGTATKRERVAIRAMLEAFTKGKR